MRRFLSLLLALVPGLAFGQATLTSTPFSRDMLKQASLGAEQTFLGIGAGTGASLAQVTNAILQNVIISLTLPAGLNISGSPIAGNGTLAVTAPNTAGFWKNNGSGVTSWGAPVEGDLSWSDLATLNVSTSKHGLVPKLPPGGTGLSFLNDIGGWTTPAGGGTVTSVGITLPTGLSVSGSPVTSSGTFAVTAQNTSGFYKNAAGTTSWAAPVEGDLSWSDILTLNVSASKHGLVPKLPGGGTGTSFLNDLGGFSVPAGGSGATASTNIVVTGTAVALNNALTNIYSIGGSSGALLQFDSPPGSLIVVSNRLAANAAKLDFNTNAVLSVSSNGVNGSVVADFFGGGGGLSNLTFAKIVGGPLTYYVATNGSSANTGLSLDSPFDIATAWPKLTPGNTVILTPGSYPATAIASVGGSPQYPAVLKSQYKWLARFTNGTGLTIATAGNVTTNLVIDGLELSSATGDGINLGHDCTLRNSYIHDAMLNGINCANANCSNNVIEYNLIVSNGKTNDTSGAHYHGMYVSGSGNTIRGNAAMFDTNGCNYQIFSSITGDTVTKDLIYNNFSFGATNNFGMLVWATDGAAATAGTNWVANNTILDGLGVRYGTILLTNNLILPNAVQTVGVPVVLGTSGAAPTVNADYQLGTNAMPTGVIGTHDVITTFAGLGFVNYAKGLWWLNGTNSAAASGALASAAPPVNFFGEAITAVSYFGAVGYDAIEAGDIRTFIPITDGADYWRTLLRKWIMPNSGLANSAITIQGTAVSLGGTALAAGSAASFAGDNISNLVFSVRTNNGNGLALVAGSPGTPSTLYLTNITAATTLASFTLSSTLASGFKLYASCSGGTDRILTFPSGCTGAGIGTPPAVTITNAKAAWFDVICIPGVNTNVFWSPVF